MASYPRSVIFYADRPMNVIEMGVCGAARDLDGTDPVLRGVGRWRGTPSFSSIGQTNGHDAALVRAELVQAGVKRLANDTEYGRSAAVFSRDIQRALAVAGRIESGIYHINGPTVADEPQMPFGGVKVSGHGRFGGKAAIAEFTDLRWITIKDPNQHYPF